MHLFGQKDSKNINIAKYYNNKKTVFSFNIFYNVNYSCEC